jgi:hypothetical protein
LILSYLLYHNSCIVNNAPDSVYLGLFGGLSSIAGMRDLTFESLIRNTDQVAEKKCQTTSIGRRAELVIWTCSIIRPKDCGLNYFTVYRG